MNNGEKTQARPEFFILDEDRESPKALPKNSRIFSQKRRPAFDLS